MGFKSSIAYLKQLNNGSKRKKRMGRPKGSKNKASSNGASLAGIGAIVESMVEEKLSAKIVKAVAALESATTALRNL